MLANTPQMGHRLVNSLKLVKWGGPNFPREEEVHLTLPYVTQDSFRPLSTLWGRTELTRFIFIRFSTGWGNEWDLEDWISDAIAVGQQGCRSQPDGEIREVQPDFNSPLTQTGTSFCKAGWALRTTQETLGHYLKLFQSCWECSSSYKVIMCKSKKIQAFNIHRILNV